MTNTTRNNTRNQLISELFYEDGERSATIASMDKQTLITKYPHLYSKHKEYIDSCGLICSHLTGKTEKGI